MACSSTHLNVYRCLGTNDHAKPSGIGLRSCLCRSYAENYCEFAVGHDWTAGQADGITDASVMRDALRTLADEDARISAAPDVEFRLDVGSIRCLCSYANQTSPRAAGECHGLYCYDLYDCGLYSNGLYSYDLNSYGASSVSV